MLIYHPPSKPLTRTRSAEDWRAFLADPEKHWKDGRSAKMLAERWEGSRPDVPEELKAAFHGTPFEDFVPLIAFPEYPVELPGGRAASQNDLCVIGRIGPDLAVVMVEGKVDESFGPLVGEWLKDASPGKLRRLAFLMETLGMDGEADGALRYQLFHRTASPVLEAVRHQARYAAMIVHSFSAEGAWLDDYRAFARALGAEGAKGRLERVPGREAPELWLGWASGVEPRTAWVSGQDAEGRALPRLVVHADWGLDPRKRWMCVAERTASASYRVSAPEDVGDPETLLTRLRERADGASVFVGFDFPIGVPVAYARHAGVEQFRDLLSQLGKGRWARFFDVAERPEEVALERPFYPMRPGGTRQKHLTHALGVDSMKDLLRICERGTAARGPASPLFWTMGAKQVGKAALLGWRRVLVPALENEALPISLWPFDGGLDALLDSGGIVVAETYPAEACVHLGLEPPGRGWAKTSQEGRQAQAAALRRWADRRGVALAADLAESIDDGFGPGKHQEDPFDALLGVMSMLEVTLGHRPEGGPEDDVIRAVEGWILGQE